MDGRRCHECGFLSAQHCTENPIYVFTEKKLRGLVTNSYIHVSVSNLYIFRIGLSIWHVEIENYLCLDIFVGWPLSGVVYFDTIIFTLLTWVTVARKLILYYHEYNQLSIESQAYFPL